MSQPSECRVIFGSNESLDRLSPQEDNALEKTSPDELSLIEFLCDSLAILWKDWPKDMRVNNLGHDRFTLRGVCPHCGENSVFALATNVATRPVGSQQEELCGAMQCQGCDE